MSEIMVDVVMVTYNQENYISQAIESVINQRTSFRFRLLISDDCSTDRTLLICRKYLDNYPDRIKVIESSINTGLVKNYKRVFEQCTARYVAILEGDDYWHDNDKLEKQIFLMEKPTGYGAVYSDVNHLLENGVFIEKVNNKKNKRTPSGYVFCHIIIKNTIPSITVCFRRELLKQYAELDTFICRKYATVDLPLWLSFSPHTKFYYMKDSTATYRIHKDSISNSRSIRKKIKFQHNVYRIKRDFAGKNTRINLVLFFQFIEILIKLVTEFTIVNLKPSRLIRKTGI